MSRKDSLGREIKIGHIIAVGRYGRTSSLDVGIVYKISKSTLYFLEGPRQYRVNSVIGINSNIILVGVDDSIISRFKATCDYLIKEAILPADYELGTPVEEDLVKSASDLINAADSIMTKESSIEAILSGMGAPSGIK